MITPEEFEIAVLMFQPEAVSYTKSGGLIDWSNNLKLLFSHMKQRGGRARLEMPIRKNNIEIDVEGNVYEEGKEPTPYYIL